MGKITKSFRIDPKIWVDVKVYCAKYDLDLSSFLESAIQEKLKKK